MSFGTAVEKNYPLQIVIFIDSIHNEISFSRVSGEMGKIYKFLIEVVNKGKNVKSFIQGGSKKFKGRRNTYICTFVW